MAHPLTPILTPILCALASAGLYAASFPPLAAFPLAWVALVPLLWALSQVGPAAGAGLGLLFGAAAGALLAPWLPRLVDAFFDIGWMGGAGAAALVCLYAGLAYAAWGAVVAWLGRRGSVAPGRIAAAWAACELLRLQGPLETPWALLAYSQAPWLSLVQSADLIGAIGLGALIAAVNVCLAGSLPRVARAPHFARAAGVTVALVVAGNLYGNARLVEDFGSGEPFSVALVQGAIGRETRLDPEAAAANLERYLVLTQQSMRSAPDLVLWPELSVRFEPAARPDLWQELMAASRASDVEWLVGAPYARRRLLVRESLNSALLLRGGQIVDRHDKVRLMPFSERRLSGLPLGWDRFRPGLALRPVEAGSAALGVLLCSESLLPGLAAELAAAGAEVLVNPSNDDWFASESATRHQVAVAVFRAVENRRPLLRISTTGRSAVVDAHGRVRALAPYGAPAVLEARLRGSRAESVHTRLARLLDPKTSGIVLSSVFWIAQGRRRARTR